MARGTRPALMRNAMTDLVNKHCQACEGGVAPLNADQARAMLGEVHADWKLNEAGNEISRGFKFKNYYQTIAFVNALAWVSHQEDHHPDLEVGYSRCLVRYQYPRYWRDSPKTISSAPPRSTH